MRRVAAIVLASLAVPAVAAAQADEIQVYDGGLAAKGTVNLTWHNNFIAKGLTTPCLSRRRRAEPVVQRRHRMGAGRHELVRGRPVLASLQP